MRWPWHSHRWVEVVKNRVEFSTQWEQMVASDQYPKRAMTEFFQRKVIVTDVCSVCNVSRRRTLRGPQ